MTLHPIDTSTADFVPAPITDEEAGALFRASGNLFRAWGVTDEQAAILLDLPLRTYRRWKGDAPGRISRDGRAR